MQLELLKSQVHDSINIKITNELISIIHAELPWILNSNVPDSITQHKAVGHTTAFSRIMSLINQGINRTSSLIGFRTDQVKKQIQYVRLWMVVFAVLSLLLLLFISINLFLQQSKRKEKEQELATVFNRINDAVISLDRNWCYTFLNDAAMDTHPLSRQETLGKSIWDIHPAAKGTIFWDKYHEAIETRKVTEIESYYAPMDKWFSIKCYPSEDGLTIFYSDVTENKNANERLSQTVKEVADYKYALDEASIVAITDQKGIIKHANENFCKISKYSIDELIGQDHRIINSGHHPKEFIKELWTSIAHGKIWKGELKNKAKDGTIYWVDTTIVPFMNDQGKPYQYVAIRSDITERKKLEEQQKLSASIINSSDDAILSKTLNGIVTSWNHGAEKVFGYTPEEMVGKHISMLIPFHLQNEESEIIQQISQGKYVERYETERLKKDGKIIQVSLTISPIKDNDGNVIGASKIVRDISRQKEAEEKIIKSERIYKTIASNIPGSVICLLDTDYRYLLIEGDMLEKFGYSKKTLLGNKAADALSPEVFASVEGVFKKTFEGKMLTRESTVLGYDIISRFIPLKDENGAVYAIMMVAIDITQLKEAHRNIEELNHDLEEKITQRTTQLKAVNKELESFSYSVSHDLRAPLRIIDGFSKILLDDYAGIIDEEGQQNIQVIIKNARKMGQLIDDLLNFSKLGRTEMRISTINMNLLIDEVLQHLQTSGIQVPTQITIHELIKAQGDNSLMKQVWENLISNAIKYSSAKKEPAIEIGMLSNSSIPTYYIKDNGAGFDMKYAGKLFGVFQRLHKVQEFSGTGVGLALVQRIILRHDGNIWADAKENEGATFYFNLP
jgi:PAS domain S-box-containing protein